MTLGSLAYVVNDGLVRVATEEGLDVYQALFLRGCAMVVLFSAWVRTRGSSLRPQDLGRAAWLRVGAEVVATALFFAALVELEFANAQTILMLVPFAVTVAAALVFGESVSRPQYLLVAIGFVGVVAVVRPTPAGFSGWSLMVVASALALVVREVATRRVPTAVPPVPVALATAVAITAMTGLLSAFRGWGQLTAPATVALGLACLCLVAGYVLTIQSVRVGDLSVSAPFRYSSVVGAVAVGLVLFDETPDALTAVGCVLIVTAGVVAARLEGNGPTSAE